MCTTDKAAHGDGRIKRHERGESRYRNTQLFRATALFSRHPCEREDQKKDGQQLYLSCARGGWLLLELFRNIGNQFNARALYTMCQRRRRCLSPPWNSFESKGVRRNLKALIKRKRDPRLS